MAIEFSVITDEVSPDLDVALRFAASEGLSTVDVRSVGGVNVLSLERARQTAIARDIRAAGFRVGCFATPLLKWPARGRASDAAGDQFGFDARGRTTAELYDDAFAAAEILGTRNLRIFSLLTYDGFKLADLEADFGALLARAEKYDMVVHAENEPVCNIRTVPDLIQLMRAWKHPRLRALLDIGNAHYTGAVPSADELAAIMPSVDQMHFKDYAGASHAYVATGEGEVGYAQCLPPCLAAARGRNLTLTIETHMPAAQPDATRRSLAALRRIAGV